MSAPEPLLTVVVCTHGRPNDLRRCLASIALLDDPVEAIVVDSASDPPCADVVVPFRARYIREDEPGLSIARNTALRAASCGLVAFVDDDTELEPDWARRILAPFSDPRVGCVGGTCVARFATTRPAWLSDRLLQYAGITHFGQQARLSTTTADLPFGANLCVRRDAVLAAGGFPETLGRIGTDLLSGEESALMVSLRRDGWLIWLQPDAVVHHHVSAERCAGDYYWRRLWWQGISRARGGPTVGITARLLIAAPVRLALWALTRDRFYLYRTAETVGYLREAARS